ncbi:MAG: alpha/beta fold hydrolase [Phycisphaerae bacterium]|jgi:pimeloyl-ACP methyl ester carboxylesterase
MKRPLYMYPGLAADARLFLPQQAKLPALVTPAWLAPEKRETLEAYARRMAEALMQQRAREGATGAYCIGGFSFGGQVALEMVQHLMPKPDAVVLVCGVRSRAQILPAFVRQQRLSEHVPAFVQRAMFGPYASWFAQREGLSAEHASLLIAMAKGNDPSFLQWSSWACANWRGEPKGVANAPGETGVKVLHLHGERDRVIPDVRKQAMTTLAGAGHLITFTHAEAVTAWLREVLER